MLTQEGTPRPIKVIGHRHPDTDSICAANTYSNLKNILDENPEYRTLITAPDGHIYSFP